MTATLVASTAILKTRYPNGKLPKLVYKRFKYLDTVKKREDFTGRSRVIAMQNENPQGSSADFNQAQAALAQGNYKNFDVTRVEHFGLARIKGQALKAAEGDEGALVDLWKNEMDGIFATEAQNLEIYCFGNGSGVLGQITGVVTGTSITLAVPTDAAKFSLNMRVTAVSTNTLSPTLRGGIGIIAAIDRVNGILTLASAWNSVFTGIVTGDYLTRAGDNASAGVAAVVMGKQGWIPGGTTPGMLFSLDRNADPVRYAGQAFNALGMPMEEVLTDCSALVIQQGAPQPTRVWTNPRDYATFKKAIGTKSTFPMTQVSGTAQIGFKAIVVAGDEDEMAVMTSPFVDRYKAHVDYPDCWTLDSLGSAPQILDFDDQKFLRVANDDAYEVRVGFYGQHECNMPWANVTVTNWGL